MDYKTIGPIKFTPWCPDTKGHTPSEIVTAAFKVYNPTANIMNRGGIGLFNAYWRVMTKMTGKDDLDEYDSQCGEFFMNVAKVLTYLKGIKVGDHRVFLDGGLDCVNWNPNTNEGKIMCYLK